MDMATSDVEDGRFHSESPESDHEQDSEMPDQSTPSGEPMKNGNNAKDPSRPRRKKARRACFACQRAHLTCGDERPCQRCIKRGLQDVCQDGVRKKAKYLHDAPNEALLPGAASHYTRPELKRNDSNPQSEVPHAEYFQPPQTYNVFNSGMHMPPPTLQERSMSAASYSQPSPNTTTFNVSGAHPLQSPGIPQDAQNGMTNPGWPGTFFDSGDQSLFNFDIASMNFGNHYGALEFGMLGHMATGAGTGETPDSDAGTQRGSVSQYQMPMATFGGSPNAQFSYGNDGVLGDWTDGANLYHLPRKDAPHAFAIESNSLHFTSPEATTHTPEGVKYEDSPILTAHGRSSPENPRKFIDTKSSDNLSRSLAHITTPQLKAKSQFPAKASKRPQDPTSIYTSVVSPYSYTAGFHQLIAYLHKRFNNAPSKTLAIAKSLASIRPSFIATNKTLLREDLIFMEKCFQRTLWEYEGFIEGVGTPTIVARRTGEIAAVGKEFQILTGWTKNVLLGRTPNLNVNRGHSGKTPAESGANTANRTTGASTPLPRQQEAEPRQQPVFLAELLDDDTVVQFYEDFARLAFGDSRGSVMGKGKLLKYRTKDDELAANLKAEAEARGENGAGDGGDLKRMDSFAQARPQDAQKGIFGEKGMRKLGSSDGKVDCAYCWTVKRDVFDIPMLIVINFLPCI